MHNSRTYSVTLDDSLTRTGGNTSIEMSKDGTSVTLSGSKTRTTRTERNAIATSLSTLEKKCKQLKQYSHIRRTELPEDAFEIFQEVSELATQVGGTSQYENYLRITRSVFQDCIPGDGTTLADFFLGCDKARPKSGSSVGCDPLCGGNLPNSGYSTEDFCDSHVGVHSSGVLYITYSPADRSDTIRISHRERDCSLSPADASKLLSKGITNAILTYTGGTVPVTYRATVQNLIKKKVRSSKNPKARSQAAAVSRKERDNCGGMSGIGWAIAAIVFFILFIIVIWLIVVAFQGQEAALPAPAAYDEGQYVGATMGEPISNNYGAETGGVSNNLGTNGLDGKIGNGGFGRTAIIGY